jgi:hypothetical protein
VAHDYFDFKVPDFDSEVSIQNFSITCPGERPLCRNARRLNAS